MPRPKKEVKEKDIKTTKMNNKKSKKVVETLPEILQEIMQTKKEFSYERLSASMLKTWLSCKRKFYINYVLGQRGEQTPALSLGSAGHEALEAANLFLQKNPKKLSPIEIEYYVQLFRNNLAKFYTESSESFEVGEQMVRTELLNKSTNKIIGVEEEFDISTPEGVRIYGFIDLLEEQDPSTLRIIDYKSSKMPMSYDEVRQDEQLSMYDLAMSIKYPQYENRILELRYLRTEDYISITKTPIEQENFRRRLLAVDLAIKEFLDTIKDIPEGNLNQFCNWCSYKAGCGVYVQHMQTMLPSFPNIGELEDNSFIEMWEKVSTISKAAESWKDSLKLWALKRIESFPETPIDNGLKQIYTLSRTRREYDTSSVCRLIPLEDLLGEETDGEPIVNISNKKLEEYLKNKNDRKLQSKIEDAVTIKFERPQIRIKKSKA